MGLFDLLGLGGSKDEREARSVRKLQKKATEKYGPKENRQGAIEELGELRTPRAIEALLMRYTVRVEPGITDDEEKQRVLALVQQAGSSIAVPVLKSFVLGRDEISWPLKALSDLLPEPEMVAFLVEALRKAAGDYSRVPEKRSSCCTRWRSTRAATRCPPPSPSSRTWTTRCRSPLRRRWRSRRTSEPASRSSSNSSAPTKAATPASARPSPACWPTRSST